MPEDVGPIIDELKAGKTPKPGPRFVLSQLNFKCCLVKHTIKLLLLVSALWESTNCVCSLCYFSFLFICTVLL